MHPVTRRIDSYLTYANNYITMKIRILNTSFQVLEGSYMEKKINVSILFKKV